MDAVNLKLLSQLQADLRTSIADLAEIAGASTASVQRRLKRLRESGVIAAETAVLDRDAVGFGVTAIISVELERDRHDQVTAFKRRARAEPQVQQCYCVAGDADFILIAVARDIKDYEAFTHRFFFADANVRRFRTSIVVSTDKATLALPLAASPSG